MTLTALTPEATEALDAALLMRACATWNERVNAGLRHVEELHYLTQLTYRFEVKHYPRISHLEVTPTAIYTHKLGERVLVAGVES